MEYAAEHVGFTGLGLSDRDTIADVALAAIGTTLAAALTWLRWQYPADRGQSAVAGAGITEPG